jgi:serine/threonine-protein kinase
MAIQIGEGLDAAHKKGVVHRDIKSDNIMATPDHRVKITDFGLAKLKGISKVTKAGTTMGTLQYMSPEQVQGKEVDGRSDIFSPSHRGRRSLMSRINPVLCGSSFSARIQ